MAEKMRSIFERTRARDVFDIWYMLKNIDIKQAIDIFPVKCTFKELIPDISDMIDRKEEFKNAWKSSLKHQLKILPEFDKVFNEVVGLMNKLESVAETGD